MSEEKKRQAFSMFCRGKSKREIASVLGTSSASVNDWIEEQRQISHSTLQRIHKEDYVGITMQRFAEIRDETWTNLQSSQKPSDRAKFLKLALDVELKEAAFLENMGFLKGEQKKQELNINIIAQLQGEVGLSRLDALALDVLSKRMGMTPQTIMAMQGAGRNVFAMPEAVGLKGNGRSLPTPQPVEAELVERPPNKTNGHGRTEGEE